MTEDNRGTDSSHKPNIEGEGSYEAAKRYKKSVDRYLAENDPQQAAEKAKQALEGESGDELKNAERIGKKPARS